MPSGVDYWRMRAGGNYPPDAPGVPCADDLRLLTKYAEQLRRVQAESGKRGIVLGVTRQIVEWCRNNDLRVSVMDLCEPAARSLQLIHKDWDGLEVLVDDWLTTNCADHSFCWAAGDGVVNAVGSGRNAASLLRQVHRLLLPGSMAVLRHLLRPFPTPAADDVFAKLARGGIRNFSAFRHQVAQSLQPSFMDGISTCVARKAILESGVLDGKTQVPFGWPAEQLKRLDYWAAEGGSLCYPTLEELRALMNPDFEELDISCGAYEMAELSPTIACRTRCRHRN